MKEGSDEYNISSNGSSVWQRVSKEKFFSEIEVLLDAARRASHSEQIEDLSDAVHQLIGIAGIFELGALEKLAKFLHDAVIDRDYDRAHAVISGLVAELNKLRCEVS